MKLDLGNLVWQEPRKKADPLDPFWDVVPIPFYPADLPDIEWEYLTRCELDLARSELDRILFRVAAV